MTQYDGTLWTREQFKAELDKLTTPSWVEFLTLHSTWAPNIQQARETPYSQGGKFAKGPDLAKAFAQRMRNLGAFFKSKGWSGGPHLYSFENGMFGVGTPMSNKGVHANDWNGKAWSLEMVADFSSKDDPYSGPGLVILDNAAWVFAQWLKKLGKPANGTTIKFHREETHAIKNGKDCPGKRVDKADFIKRVQAYMSEQPITTVIEKTTEPVPAPSESLGTVTDIQTRLALWGYDPGPIDGIMGPRTALAIAKFQESLGLKGDGKVGPYTWKKLSETPPPKPAEPKPPVADVPTKDRHMSDKGIVVLQHFEGLRLTPYDDNGSLAIGYGHSNRSHKPPTVVDNMTITEPEAVKILKSDLVEYEDDVKKMVKVDLTEGQFDALVSICYNWGPGYLRKSDLIKLINEKRFVEAAQEIVSGTLPNPSSKYYAGILRRRKSEADLFKS